MKPWLGPARCQGCGARVWYSPQLRFWCNAPTVVVVRHVCPEVAK